MPATIIAVIDPLQGTGCRWKEIYGTRLDITQPCSSRLGRKFYLLEGIAFSGVTVTEVTSSSTCMFTWFVRLPSPCHVTR